MPPTDPTQGDAPEVSVIARPDDVHLDAPSTNPALQLASSLQHTSEDLSPFLTQLGGELRARAGAKAQADALANSGQAFADAVKAGKIEPTQNPWYIQAYEKSAAQVRAQGQVAAFVTQMQSDPTKNDPQAYATKFNQGLGQIAQQFTGINQSAGFHAAADPLAEQALNQNEAYNVQRIQQEHIQNTTSLATQAVMDTLKANPKATPDQVFGALEDQHKAWIGVGGDESQWRMIVKQSVVGASANTGNSGLIDVLKAPYQGGEPIANQSDESGKPTGLELQSDKFWIDRGMDADMLQDYKAHMAAVAKEGVQVDQWANQHYGSDYAFGRVPQPQLEADAQAQGFSPQSIVWAMDKQGEALRGVAGYSVAQSEVYSTDPNVQKRILAVNHEALTAGLTPHLTNELSDMVGRQQITKEMALNVMDRASGQTHFAIGENNAQRRADASLAIQKWSLVGDSARGAFAKSTVILGQFGVDFGKLPTKVQEQFKADVENAAMAVGEKGPQAAQEAAENAAAKLIPQFVKRFKAGALPPTLVNPNATPNQPGKPTP